ncbi:hypothetical protein VTL71DRAFT_2699 [Oculimacula yallundae]|uniref:Uncharacterized protein n=1 Tax=Oculimacula yallundae TaxID=86028 RepID=A0ABR4C9M1_9HELO
MGFEVVSIASARLNPGYVRSMGFKKYRYHTRHGHHLVFIHPSLCPLSSTLPKYLPLFPLKATNVKSPPLPRNCILQKPHLFNQPYPSTLIQNLNEKNTCTKTLYIGISQICPLTPDHDVKHPKLLKMFDGATLCRVSQASALPRGSSFSLTSSSNFTSSSSSFSLVSVSASSLLLLLLRRIRNEVLIRHCL